MDGVITCAGPESAEFRCRFDRQLLVTGREWRTVRVLAIIVQVDSNNYVYFVIDVRQISVEISNS